MTRRPRAASCTPGTIRLWQVFIINPDGIGIDNQRAVEAVLEAIKLDAPNVPTDFESVRPQPPRESVGVLKSVIHSSLWEERAFTPTGLNGSIRSSPIGPVSNNLLRPEWRVNTLCAARRKNKRAGWLLLKS